MQQQPVRLVIASNRLPCVVERENSSWGIRPGSGGLVTALAPVLRNRGGTWIGWAGTVEEDDVNVEHLLLAEGQRQGYALRPVVISEDERQAFYYGFSNEVIWPLFHSLDERCNFAPRYWEAYKTVNQKYARAIQQSLDGSQSYVWVHDYHLMLVGSELRRAGIDARLGFFLHTPFPSLDIFLKLPWRFDVLRGLLDYDLLGFQTVRDRGNFIRCVRTLLPEARTTGRGRIQEISTSGRKVRIGAFPISIDFREFANKASGPEVTSQANDLVQQYPGRQIILGVDRLDYTKGIPYRLKAFRYALANYPELHRKVTLVQVVVPSRKHIPAYQLLREDIDELVGEINGEYTEPGWVPVHYSFRSLDRTELLAYYRIADVGLVTPLIDGMNLVAKEFCACNVQKNGVLVLSEFAGAAAELQTGAILVNPYDVAGVAEALRRALSMDETERRDRTNRLRRVVRRKNVFTWLDSFLDASIALKLDDFPPVDHYIPSEPAAPKSKSKAAVEHSGVFVGRPPAIEAGESSARERARLASGSQLSTGSTRA